MNWDDEEETLWQRHRWLLPSIVVTVGGGVAFAFTQVKTNDAPAPSRAPERMIMIAPPPPPPKPLPPPPPKPSEPKQEEQKEQMIEQEKVEEKEEKPAPQDDPPPALGTGIKGDGAADGFGLGTRGNGMIGGNGNGSGRKKGSAFGWYAAQIQTSIADAVRRNGKTKFASGSRDVRVWVDSTGRITRATISGGGGESDVNVALNNEVLTGLQFRDAPPANMPMPIVLRISAQRPN
jgi:periplasmic protein TonB